MAKFKGTAAGIRSRVEALTTPPPKGREAKNQWRRELKEKHKGSELQQDELQNRLNHRSRVVPRRKNTRGNRSHQQAKVIGEFQ